MGYSGSHQTYRSKTLSYRLVVVLFFVWALCTAGLMFLTALIIGWWWLVAWVVILGWHLVWDAIWHSSWWFH